MMYLVVAAIGLLGLGASGEPCECTGSNEGIPEDSPHVTEERWKDFGKYCDTWDVDLPVCQVKDPPGWCTDRWCYVKEGCTVNGQVTARDSTYEGSNLFFSYPVCGNKDQFDVPGFKYTWKECPERDYPVDIYFAIDESGSITSQEWDEMHEFMEKLIKKGMTHDDDRVGIVTWAQEVRSRYTFSKSKEDIVDLLQANDMDKVKRKGNTWTYTAIMKSLELMDKETRRENAKRHFILVTDGIPDPGHDICSYRKPIYEEDNPTPIRYEDITIPDEDKEKMMKKIEDLDVTFTILAIDSQMEGKKYPFDDALGCIVVDDRLDITENQKARKMYEKLVVMDNFFSFYQYRDPTSGDMCVDGEMFSRSYAPTLAVTEKPTPEPTKTPVTMKPTAEPTGFPVTMKPTHEPTGVPVTMKPTHEPTDEPTVAPTPCNNPAPTCPDCDKKKDDDTCVPEYDDDDEDPKKCSKKSQKKCSKMTACTWDKDMNRCMGTGGDSGVCSGIRYQATCEDLKNCDWDKDTRMCKGSTKSRDYGVTRGPRYWQMCAENFCMKHTWDGGVGQCHYDHAKHGCGCMGITDMKECKKTKGCMLNKQCNCVEETPCEKLNYKQCKADDRCTQCFGGCRRKCSLAPGVELDEDQTLVMNQATCTCEIHNSFVCNKKCCKTCNKEED